MLVERCEVLYIGRGRLDLCGVPAKSLYFFCHLEAVISSLGKFVSVMNYNVTIKLDLSFEGGITARSKLVTCPCWPSITASLFGTLAVSVYQSLYYILCPLCVDLLIKSVNRCRSNHCVNYCKVRDSGKHTDSEHCCDEILIPKNFTSLGTLCSIFYVTN